MDRERTKLRRKNIKERNRLFVEHYLQGKSCVDCGLDDIRVLEFDHVRGDKKGNVCRMIKDGASLDSLLIEMKKCEIRCCNCHRNKTQETLYPSRQRRNLQQGIFMSCPEGKEIFRTLKQQ